MLPVAITGVGVVAASVTTSAELAGVPGAGRWLVGVDGRLDLSGHLDALQLRSFDRASQLAVVAAKLALEDAGGWPGAPSSLGVCLGNTHGCLEAQIALDRAILTEGPQAVSGTLFPYGAFNAAAANVAIVLHARGANLTFATGAAAGTDACAEAARQLQDGCVTCMLGGGVEAPGDAAVLLLESRDAADGRGARTRGMIAGAASRVADDDSRAGFERAAAWSARSALEEAGIVAGDVRLVVGEVELLAKTFDGRSVPTISAESTFGEAPSASGAFHVVLAVLSLRSPAERGPVLCLSRTPEGIVSVVTP